MAQPDGPRAEARLYLGDLDSMTAVPAAAEVIPESLRSDTSLISQEGNLAIVDFGATPVPDFVPSQDFTEPESIYAHMSEATFRDLDGSRQEFALMDRFLAGDFESIGRFRADFQMGSVLTPAQRQVAYDVEAISYPDGSSNINYDNGAFDRVKRNSPIEKPDHLFKLFWEAKKRRQAALDDQDIDPSNSLFLVNYEAIGRVEVRSEDGSARTVELPNGFGVFEPAILYRALLERKAGIAPPLEPDPPMPILEPDSIVFIED